MKLKIAACLLLTAFGQLAFAQDSAPKDWFLLNPSDGYPGVNMENTYKQLLKDRKSETIIVAVIDSGVDAEHEDLKDIMWVNEDEIPNNGIDDDKNGYVDDIHGWNFIGGKDGKNVNHDALEITRLVAKYNKEFAGKNPDNLSKKEKKKYENYMEMKKEIEKKKESLAQQAMGPTMFANALETIKEHLGKDSFTAEDLDGIKEGAPEDVMQSKAMLTEMVSRGASIAEIEEQITGYLEYLDGQANYYYNPDFDPRDIVGDDYNNVNERYYGNNDVEGPDANHGTHVAGIIAATRGNDVGMDGIANNVRIMSVRCVPDGDERDKDVANAIRYAVDNGATIINMSFGKSYKWNKNVVDKAVKYARKKDVLLVHAAGNDGSNTDEANNFPNDKYLKRGWFKPKYADNWIEVGAAHWKGGDNMAASFSNYGKENVDLFAPGTAIYSTTVDDNYASYQGTSMASPVVAGVAAVIRSHFPTLTAQQVKDVLMSTSTKQSQKVKQPGSKDTMIPFSDLSVTGGTLDAYKAVQKAMMTKGKRKNKIPTTKSTVVVP